MMISIANGRSTFDIRPTSKTKPTSDIGRGDVGRFRRRTSDVATSDVMNVGRGDVGRHLSVATFHAL